MLFQFAYVWPCALSLLFSCFVLNNQVFWHEAEAVAPVFKSYNFNMRILLLVFCSVIPILNIAFMASYFLLFYHMLRYPNQWK